MNYYFIGYFVTVILLTANLNVEKFFSDSRNEFEFAADVLSLFLVVIISAIWPLGLPVIIGFLIKKIWKNKTTKR